MDELFNDRFPNEYLGDTNLRLAAVSYTHLDVYKRQLLILGVLVAIQGIKKLLEKPEAEKAAKRA